MRNEEAAKFITDIKGTEINGYAIRVDAWGKKIDTRKAIGESMWTWGTLYS